MKSIENLTVSDYVKIFRRRIWYIVITTIAVSIGTIVYVKQLTPTYKSETTILIASRLLPTDFIQSLDRLTSTDRIDAVRRLLESRSFLERIVQEFQLQGAGGSLQDAMAFVGASVEITVPSPTAFKLGFYAPDPNLAQAVTRRIAEIVIQSNESAVRQNAQSGDQIIEDLLRTAEADMSAKLAALTQFRSQHSSSVGSQVATPKGFDEAQAQLTATETRLADALEARRGLERRIEEQRGLKKVIASPTPRVATAPAPAAIAAAAPSAAQLELARKRAELAAFSSRYTPAHIDVIRLTREVAELEATIAKSAAAAKSQPTDSVATSVPSPSPALPEIPEIEFSMLVEAELQAELAKTNREIASLEQARKTLATKVAQLDRQLNPPPSTAQELARLEDDYASAERGYKALAERKLSSAIAARVDGSEGNEPFKILEAAFLPVKPIGPKRRLFAIAGCLGGLLVGFGLAFVRELLDNSFHDETDVAFELNLPILAGVPAIASRSEDQSRKKELPLSVVRLPLSDEDGRFSVRMADSKILEVVQNPLGSAGEPYRLMHAKLALMQRERGIKTVLITSAIPNEGKTFAACCLAGVFARDRGKKVLLIDADLRTGNAGQVLGLNNGAVGLNQLLTGGYQVSSTGAGNHPNHLELLHTPDLARNVVKCADLNLYFLPSGTTMDEPSQLSNLPLLDQLIRQAEEMFDWVIIDSPPVLALSDANLLAPLCDATLFVIRSGKTSATLVKDAIQRIGPERVCGLLLNQVRKTSANHGYYAYYQGGSPPKLGDRK